MKYWVSLRCILGIEWVTLINVLNLNFMLLNQYTGKRSEYKIYCMILLISKIFNLVLLHIRNTLC